MHLDIGASAWILQVGLEKGEVVNPLLDVMRACMQEPTKGKGQDGLKTAQGCCPGKPGMLPGDGKGWPVSHCHTLEGNNDGFAVVVHANVAVRVGDRRVKGRLDLQGVTVS